MTSHSTRFLLALTLLGASTACNGGGGEEADSGVPLAVPTTVEPSPGSGDPSTEVEPPSQASQPGGPSPRDEAWARDRDLAIQLGFVEPDPLVVSDLLTHADIRELVRYDGALTVTSVEGIAPTPQYNSLRLATENGFGFSIQLWTHDEARQAQARFERLQQTWIQATAEAVPVGDASFSGEFDALRYFAFFDTPSRSTAVVTCQVDLCDPVQIRAIAERAQSRL
jgi:hypothetical protein